MSVLLGYVTRGVGGVILVGAGLAETNEAGISETVDYSFEIFSSRELIFDWGVFLVSPILF